MGIFVEKKKEEPESSAVRPNIFLSLPSFMRNEEAQKKGATDEERIFAAGANTEFWKELKNRIEQIKAELDQTNSQAIANGATLEQIGQNTIVITMTKGVLDKIFNTVEDAREAIEDGQGT